jgi:hypothetical protein
MTDHDRGQVISLDTSTEFRFNCHHFSMVVQAVNGCQAEPG